MAEAAEARFRQGLARILLGISVLLFALLLMYVGLPSSGAGAGVAEIVVLIIGIIGLIMAVTGYGEITEPSRR